MDPYEKQEQDYVNSVFDDDDDYTISPVQEFYKDKTILVTGGSGFLGTLLIEKLLRACRDIRKLILVVRDKRGVSAKKRVVEQFKTEVYSKMKVKNPNYYKQVQVICGSWDEEDFGLTFDEIQMLQQQVEIIFHAAATVRFDEHIRIAYNVNVRGTKTLLKFAQNMKNLKAFVYVSTAYSQSHLRHIEEKFYEPAFTDEEMMMLLEKLDDTALSILTPKILNGRFNTYTMTKGLAEHVIGQHYEEMPLAVYRPSIVTSTLDEPLKSWTNSISGATGVVIGSSVGFLRTLYCDPDVKAEIIPADIVINGLILIPFHLQTARKEKNPTVPVYNFVGDEKCTISWKGVMDLLSDISRKLKIWSPDVLWCYHLSLDKTYWIWLVKFYVYHLLPVPFFIILEKLTKRKPRVWNGYIKLYLYTLLYSFFMNQSWQFDVSNTIDLYESSHEKDKRLFNCNRKIEWDYYFTFLSKGVGAHILNFDWNKLESESMKMKKLRYKMMILVDKIIVWGIRFLFVYLFLKYFVTIFAEIL